MPEFYPQQFFFAVTPLLCARNLTFSLEILLEVLKTMRDAGIRWPTNPMVFEEYSAMTALRHLLVDKGFCQLR